MGGYHGNHSPSAEWSRIVSLALCHYCAETSAGVLTENSNYNEIWRIFIPCECGQHTAEGTAIITWKSVTSCFCFNVLIIFGLSRKNSSIFWIHSKPVVPPPITASYEQSNNSAGRPVTSTNTDFNVFPPEKSQLCFSVFVRDCNLRSSGL